MPVNQDGGSILSIFCAEDMLQIAVSSNKIAWCRCNFIIFGIFIEKTLDLHVLTPFIPLSTNVKRGKCLIIRLILTFFATAEKGPADEYV
jgi:hypothetical protein